MGNEKLVDDDDVVDEEKESSDKDEEKEDTDNPDDSKEEEDKKVDVRKRHYMCQIEAFFGWAADEILAFVQTKTEISIDDMELILEESDVVQDDIFTEVMEAFSVVATERIADLNTFFMDLQQSHLKACKLFAISDAKLSWTDFATNFVDLMDAWIKARSEIAKIEAQEA